MYSLNMSICFVGNDKLFRPHVRICPRMSNAVQYSQINYMKMLHNESLTTIVPEDVCKGMREIWKI